MKLSKLSPEARKKAIEWFANEQGVWSEDFELVYENLVTCLGFLGIEVSTRPIFRAKALVRHAPVFEWSGFYSHPGDGLAFSGKWRAQNVNWLALEEHAPNDEELDRLGKAFTLMALRYPHGTAEISNSGNNIHIDESSTNTETGELNQWGSLDVNHEGWLFDHIVDVASWCYKQLKMEHEYQTSEEACVEGIEANMYEFNENGALA